MASVDVVTASGAADVDIYADDISMYLAAFCDVVGVENPKDLSSMQWSGALRYIYSHVYKHNKSILKCDYDIKCYDIDKVNALCDYYIDMCLTYGQRICIEHFSYLSGIESQTICDWKNGMDRAYIYLDSDHNVISYNNSLSGNVSGVRKIPTSNFKAIYQKLVQSTITAADDIMLTRSGVNSIAYRNAVQERYAARQDTGAGSVDVVGLADQLGIAGDVGRLVSASGTKDS
jgi:hypothetical protein